MHIKRAALNFTVLATAFASWGEASATASFDYDMSMLGVQMIDAAPENSWVKLNQNKYRDVWIPEDRRATSYGSPSNIIGAWSSFAYDSNRAKLTLWGGGHANYAGNEVYRWDFNTLSWENASLPSEVVNLGGGVWQTVDGVHHSPIAAHTYDTNVFLPIADRLVVFGGPNYDTGVHFQDYANGNKRTGPYFWDPSKADPNKVGGLTGSQVNPAAYPGVVGGEMWQNRDNLNGTSGSLSKPGLTSPGWVNTATAYAEEGGKDVVYVQAGTALHRYIVSDANDASTDVYQLAGWQNNSATWSGQGAGAYSPDHQLFLRTAEIGNNPYFVVWDTSVVSRNVLITPLEIGAVFPDWDLDKYGLDYDPIRERFLLWNAVDVWELIPPTHDYLVGTWELKKLLARKNDGSAPNRYLLPTNRVDEGVLGKWEYVPELDVFLGLLDRQNGDVWAYKPTGWNPTLATLASNSAAAPVASSLLLLLSMGAPLLMRFHRSRLSGVEDA